MRIPAFFQVRWTEFSFSIINSILISWHALVLFMQDSREKEAKRFLLFLINLNNLRMFSFLADTLLVFSRHQQKLQYDFITILTIYQDRGRQPLCWLYCRGNRYRARRRRICAVSLFPFFPRSASVSTRVRTYLLTCLPSLLKPRFWVLSRSRLCSAAITSVFVLRFNAPFLDVYLLSPYSPSLHV